MATDTPHLKNLKKRARVKEEREWAEKCGPVKTYVDRSIMKPAPAPEKEGNGAA